MSLPVRRRGLTAVVLAIAVLATTLGASGCATYRDDLDRAMGHYNANEYDKSLALLSVLEPDLDSLADAQRAQYEYYRGMSHFRLTQRFDARHWLGRSAAREKAHKGSLSADEQTRLKETLDKLNEERYGGASTEAGAKSCNVDDDCDKGDFCDAGRCKASSDKAGNGEDADSKDADGKASDSKASDSKASDEAADSPKADAAEK